jgi:uncharacterized protein (DUF433 family)
MGAPGKAPAIKTEVVSDPTVMSGDPVVKGTRILTETILGYLRADYSPQGIFEDYPSLPVDGIGSVHVREWNAGEHDIGHISNPSRP